MFFREFKYMLLSSLRSRELIFWTLLFPFALTTFMYMALGDIFDRTEKFEPVPVAIVKEQDNMTLTAMLNAVSAEGDKKLLITTYTGEKEAKKLLEEDQVKGIIYMGNKLSLTVKESGMDETMLQSVLKQFTKYETLIQDTAQNHPDKIEQAVKPMQQEMSYFTKEENTRGNQDNVVNYFYAIFAMTCLFASFSGCAAILQMQANLTPLGQRRNVCGMKKSTMFVADFAATELVQFVLACALLIYMRFVLNLQIGERYAAMVLLLFVGTSFGIVFGMLIGSIAHLSEGGKIGVLVEVAIDVVNDEIKEMAKNVAMQVAAISPKYTSRDEVSKDYIEHETEILKVQAMNENPDKPENIIEKMIVGRLNKELKEVCLLDQAYVKAEDGKQAVGKYVEQVAKANGANVTIKGFVRFETGEGIEKKEEDFAAEVAAQLK